MSIHKLQVALFFTGMLLVLSSCNQTTILTTDKSHEENYYLSEADTAKGSIYINLTVEIPVCYNDQSIVDYIRARIFSVMFGKEYATMGVDTVVKRFAADLKKEYRLNNEPILEMMDSIDRISLYNEHVIEGFSLLSDENIFSYGMNRYVFMGGAHGLNTRTYFNFNLKNGKQITEKDLFKPGTDSLLVELIKSRIVEERKDDPELDPIERLEDSDYWVEAIKLNGNFYITDQSINYVYNPYEIAPYYMGQTEVTLPFDRIKKYLKPKGLIDYLVYPSATN